MYTIEVANRKGREAFAKPNAQGFCISFFERPNAAEIRLLSRTGQCFEYLSFGSTERPPYNCCGGWKTAYRFYINTNIAF